MVAVEGTQSREKSFGGGSRTAPETLTQGIASPREAEAVARARPSRWTCSGRRRYADPQRPGSGTGDRCTERRAGRLMRRKGGRGLAIRAAILLVALALCSCGRVSI